MTTHDAVRHALPADVSLTRGFHPDLAAGACLMELVSFVADEPWSDAPVCVSPVLGAFGRQLNDVLPDDARQQLIPVIPRLIGTADDGKDATRRWLARDWTLRVYLPAFLDVAGCVFPANALHVLSPVTTDDHLARSLTLIAAAREAVREAAWAAVWEPAGTAAWAATSEAAWDAAGAAAREAAWAAAGDAAWETAGTAAWAATSEAAWDAARQAAEGAAESAAEGAAEGAAVGAATRRLAPTVTLLQASAIRLFDVLISCATTDARTTTT